MRPTGWRDWLGIAASIACAIHCAAMPLVIGQLTVLGLSFLGDAVFHRWMVAICLALAVLAFVPGWRLHRRRAPAAVAACGLMLIAFSAFAGEQACCTPVSRVAVANVDERDECASMCCEEEDAEPEAKTVERPPVAHAAAGLGAWDILTPLGGLLLVAGHWHNRKMICRCACPAGRCTGSA